MKRTAILTLAFGLFVLVSLPLLAEKGAEAPEITGSYAVEDGVRVLRLWGTPRERGFAQGWLLAKEIVRGAGEGIKWALEGRMEVYRTQLRPLATFGFRFSTEEGQELAGILAGLKARLSDAERKIGILGRELDIVDLKVLNTFGDWYALGCSSAAVWGPLTEDGTAAVVRNFDFNALDLMLSSQHVRIAAPLPGDGKKRGWVGLCHPAGVGAMTAMNSDGVFASIHDVNVLPKQKDYLQGNVPRLVALKRLMEELGPKGAVENAAKLCKSWNTLFGNNFMVATPAPGGGLHAGVIEYDTREDKEKGVNLRGPDALEGGGNGGPDELEDVRTRGYVVCSNHHRSRANGRCSRYDSLMEGCAEAGAKPLDVKALFALAERSAVPKAGKAVTNFGTLHQTVALTGAKKLWVRILEKGGNIRDAKQVEFDVTKLLGGLGK